MHFIFWIGLIMIHFTSFIPSTAAPGGGVGRRGVGRHPTGQPHSWRGVATASSQSLTGHLHDHQTKGIFVSNICVHKYDL